MTDWLIDLWSLIYHIHDMHLIIVRFDTFIDYFFFSILYWIILGLFLYLWQYDTGSPLGTRVHVGGLSTSTTLGELRDEFKRYGEIVDMWMARTQPCFAFIVYKRRQQALDAIKDMDGEWVLFFVFIKLFCLHFFYAFNTFTMTSAYSCLHVLCSWTNYQCI